MENVERKEEGRDMSGDEQREKYSDIDSKLEIVT